ncbi:UNVERIFIED_CONTAM: hypothetical protein Sangu_1325900 [Sesamum angustifolium]|uniref:DUF4218 domain-containing protein n=1 Tax=Sesamum angustifolium TaxID=2727405 RepID=A0AAW2NKP8_9LAMI
MTLTLCKLERIFPPAYFDVIIHLMIHLASEAKLTGLVQYRWMFSFERKLGVFKRYVCNKARLEACIAEQYIDNECLTFCSMYLHNVETRFSRMERNYDIGEQLGLANDELISLANGPDTRMGGPRRRVVGQSEPSSSHGDSNVHSHEEIVNSTSTRIKRRGRTRNVALSRRKDSNEKLAIQIPKEINRIIGMNSQYAISESGCLIRRFAPLQVTKWAKIEEGKKLDLLRDFRGSFDYGDNLRYDKEKNRGFVGPIELYKLTRYKYEKDSENGCWVSAVAKENYEKMMELRKTSNR